MLNVVSSKKKGLKLSCVHWLKPGRCVTIVGQLDGKINYSLQHSEQHQGHHQCTQRRARADECQLGQNELFLRTPLGQKVVRKREKERGECSQTITGLI